MELAYIPSPSRGVIHLGPIPLRGYAFCIIIGVFVAVWLGNKRWIARAGGPAPSPTSRSGPSRSDWSAGASIT
ncbi:Phosphatidylglycerol--prolipoprotein diacylglyceryl transferase [Streptomyces spiroverticillatus]